MSLAPRPAPRDGRRASITLRDVAKRFGDTVVLERISLDIAAGEFVALVGPSGCGKSTLLRIIAGLETADEGEIRIGGRVVDEVRASARDIAMVFQSYALYPHLTVQENLTTPLRLRDLSRRDRLPLIGPLLGRARHRAVREEVRETARTLGLESLLARKPGALSGGQRQRVALGRAMVRRPVAFLMDEPLSNLDATLRVRMRAELAELHRALGTTFVHVTHDQAEALTMADRIAVMMEGRILQLGTPEAVYADPIDLRVARFIGSPEINCLPGEIGADGLVRVLGVAFIHLDPAGATLSGRSFGDRPHDARDAAEAAEPSDTRGDGTTAVTVAIRAEHLAFDALAASGWDGRVVHRENLGADVHVHVALADGAHRVVVRTTAEDGGERHALGADVRVAARGERALVFDANGRRVRGIAPAAVARDTGTGPRPARALALRHRDAIRGAGHPPARLSGS